MKTSINIIKRIIAGFVAISLCFPTIPAGESFAEGQDFSSCELLIAAPGPDFFEEGTDIISSCNGIYLTRYEDAYATAKAYEYYSTVSSLVEVNGSFQANEASPTDSLETEETTEEVIEETAEETTEESTEDDEYNLLDDVPISDYSGCIALIDTGASGTAVVGAVSVLGGSAADDNGHGTILSNAISEANSEARILSIKALDSSSTGKVSDVYTAIEYAIRANVSVINLSLCSVSVADSELMRAAICDAVARGIIVVASAGNNGRDALYYTPANISSIYTIGAADSYGNRISSSNYGSVVDYYVTADSTSVAAAKFSAYVLNGIDTVTSRSDVFTPEYVESEKSENSLIFEPAVREDEEVEIIPFSHLEEDQTDEPDTKPNIENAESDTKPNTQNDSSQTESSQTESSQTESTSFYTLPSTTDIEGNKLPSTGIMGITTPTSSEVAEEILLRGALSESSSWADCLNTIYGFGVTGQAVDSRPSGYPRWINATGMSINNGTSSGVTSNYTGAISSFGTLTAYGGDSLSSFTVYGEDDPSKVHTACYDHHVGIDKSVPPLGVQSIASINFEYAGYDSWGWYYYCAIINDWVSSGHQRIFAYICIKKIKSDEPEPEPTWYYYGFGVKKEDEETHKPIGGVSFDIYNEDWGAKIGSVTTSESDGIGVFRWSDKNYYGRNFKVMLIETNAPEGYKENIGKRFGPFGVKGASVDPSPCTDKMFEVSEVGIEASVTNIKEHSYDGAVGVVKKDTVSGKNIKGVVFDIYTAQNPSSTYLGSITTDAYGRGTIGWTSKTKYSVVYAYEKSAPFPYEKNVGRWYQLPVYENANSIVYKEIGNETTYNLSLLKKSSNEIISSGNPNYDLDGTTYEIYRSVDNEYCGALEIDSEGHTKHSLDITKWMTAAEGGGYLDTEFYYKETKVGKNYSLSNLEKSGKFTVLSSNRETVVEVTDKPEIDTVNLRILKKDITGAEADLSGAEFSVDYYMLDASEEAEYSVEDLLSISPTRTWVIKTDTSNAAYLDEEHKVSGDDFYLDDDTSQVGIPLGWLTIREIKEPEGYLLSDEVSLIKIDAKSAAEDSLNVISSTSMNSDGTGAVLEIPVRADIALEKLDYESGAPMAGVEFEIRNVTTGETHIIRTEEDGRYDSSEIAHSSENGLWFAKSASGGEGDVMDSLGALSIGDYEVREVACDANQGYQLEGVKTFAVTKDDDGKVFNIFDEEATESDGKIHNVKSPRLATTARVLDTDSHILAINEQQTIEDVVEFWNLDSAETFTLLGRLMVKEADGTFHPYKKMIKEQDGSYKETDEDLISVLTFKTGDKYAKSFFEQCGSRTVTFENVIAPESDAGKSYVVFEYLYKGEYTLENIKEAGDPYIKHEEDIYEQTLYVPRLSTTATDKADGDKELEVDSDVTVVDKVLCESFDVNENIEYKMKGWLVYKSTGEKVLVNGKPIEAEKTFIVSKDKNEVELEFSFNTKDLADTEIVVFEECYTANGKLLGWHKDLADAGQTVKVKSVSKTESIAPKEEITTEEKPTEEKVEGETAPKSAVVETSNVTSSPKTGDDTLIQIFASILLMSAIGSVYILYKKKKYKTKPESTKEE